METKNSLYDNPAISMHVLGELVSVSADEARSHSARMSPNRVSQVRIRPEWVFSDGDVFRTND
jgi:hypothetical protein